MGVKSLDDNSVFNAGTGAVLTIDGRCELDASMRVAFIKDGMEKVEVFI